MDRNNKTIINFGLDRIDTLKAKEIEFEEKMNNEKKDLKDGIIENNFEEYLKELSYESAKKVVEKMRYVLDYKEFEQFKNGILKEIKLRDYPILDGAYNFPVLNEIEFLSKEEIKILDKYLSTPRLRAIHLVGISRELKIKEDIALDVIDFLLDSDIVENEYEIRCGKCFNCEVMKRLNKKEYSYYKRFFEISEKDEDGLTEEEIEFYNNNEKDYITGFCDCCDNEVFINNLEDFKKYVQVGDYYKIIAEPTNTELDEI